MLHEILLALVGCTGDLIIYEREHHKSFGIPLYPDTPISDQCCFKLASDISFIDRSERDLIERLIALGFYYRELDRFTTKSRNLSWIRSGDVSSSNRASELSNRKTQKPSIYRRAFANGLVEVLSVYRSVVLQIEQKLLSETMPILATVIQGLNKFFVILPPLYELVLEIERDDLHGGKLLNLLHKRFHCGVPELQACIQRLLWHGHQVLYNQLVSWMVYGTLQDHHGEFFIRRQEDQNMEYGSSIPDISEKLARLSADDTSLMDWHLGFHIVLDMLPEYIHMHAAESILFANKAIRILRNPSPGFKFQDAIRKQQTGKGSQNVHESAAHHPFHKKPISGRIIGEELLPQSEADKIETMLQDLKESLDFHKRSLECSVDSIRAIAASHLWQLVVVRADLNGHLKALKDYFLLAKGDFFQCFLEESQQLMCLPPHQSTAEIDIMVPFQMAAIKSISQEDKYFSRVSCGKESACFVAMKSSQVDLSKTKTNGDGSSETSLDGWDGIVLEYSVDWPLQLFFTKEVLSKYRTIFQYLLRLKRRQLELEKSWASVMHQDPADFARHYNDRMNHSTSQPRWQHFRPMWHIDVVESQWDILQSHIQNSNDFTELVTFHQEYLSALISQSFLDIGSVSRILGSITTLCLQFCWTIENQESSQNTCELERITEYTLYWSNLPLEDYVKCKEAIRVLAPRLTRIVTFCTFFLYKQATARGVLNVVRPRPSQ
ncbi:gamma-tubulin complex component 4-like [Gossypium australe]|uniref:Gamma-tubulin complex component n=1 Tax=Gossypium australe TaxID=47621 RepID=A0A5B6VPB7_9ROSI|nr:gamma-tubulin complex component 4-like [Gossypium australe]